MKVFKVFWWIVGRGPVAFLTMQYLRGLKMIRLLKRENSLESGCLRTTMSIAWDIGRRVIKLFIYRYRCNIALSVTHITQHLMRWGDQSLNEEGMVPFSIWTRDTSLARVTITRKAYSHSSPGLDQHTRPWSFPSASTRVWALTGRTTPNSVFEIRKDLLDFRPQAPSVKLCDPTSSASSAFINIPMRITTYIGSLELGLPHLPFGPLHPVSRFLLSSSYASTSLCVSILDF